MRVLVADQTSDKLLERLRGGGLEVDYRPGIPREELLKVVEGYEILVVRSRTKVDKEVIDRGARLKIVARYGVGLDNIAVDYAIKRGIAVINAPNAPTRSAAELTLGLMIALARRIPILDREVKAGGWPKGKYVGRELYGKKLGVVGFGRIGRTVAQYARALGMEVVASDVIDVSAEAAKIGARQVPLERLLAESDVVSLHVPLTPSTYRLMDDDRLSLLKDGAMLINTSRGEVVDIDALAKHIDRLWGVALDVLPEEPPRSEKLLKLLSHEKVIVTPHVGSETYEAYDRLAEELALNILEAVKRI
ncbi:D-3-phosphoglycerate dehydrogenase (serA) [Thermoproteus uzoniensis 768-20]|uniref:D-3-phosphoglycerate dehydrogenase (SerA) n=1 Tax=Thermoproteus uzoniensis (strain 768-20) TaxID=999630 RepID=F2L1B5_THEU7|nr:D-2-hydroxyacid dehydrogenase [Thermoproteus uzoniensis]AEA12851.1 D-3-phosphoglycerate dehydrogenase (serA) [Thermoproteus uzoniensis 768-20]